MMVTEWLLKQDKFFLVITELAIVSAVYITFMFEYCGSGLNPLSYDNTLTISLGPCIYAL